MTIRPTTRTLAVLLAAVLSAAGSAAARHGRGGDDGVAPVRVAGMTIENFGAVGGRSGSLVAVYRIAMDRSPLERALGEMDANGFYDVFGVHSGYKRFVVDYARRPPRRIDRREIVRTGLRDLTHTPAEFLERSAHPNGCALDDDPEPPE